MSVPADNTSSDKRLQVYLDQRRTVTFSELARDFERNPCIDFGESSTLDCLRRLEQLGDVVIDYEKREVSYRPLTERPSL